MAKGRRFLRELSAERADAIDMDDDPYSRLACAIVLKAITDFRYGYRAVLYGHGMNCEASRAMVFLESDEVENLIGFPGHKILEEIKRQVVEDCRRHQKRS